MICKLVTGRGNFTYNIIGIFIYIYIYIYIRLRQLLRRCIFFWFVLLGAWSATLRCLLFCLIWVIFIGTWALNPVYYQRWNHFYLFNSPVFCFALSFKLLFTICHILSVAYPTSYLLCIAYSSVYSVWPASCCTFHYLSARSRCADTFFIYTNLFSTKDYYLKRK